MDAMKAIFLFLLGIGAAFLAYYAWHHINLDRASISSASLRLIPPVSPSVARVTA